MYITIKNYLKKFFTGLTVPQHYVCLPLESFGRPLQVKLITKNFEPREVTGSHLLLGYKPVVIALIFDNDKDARAVETEIQLDFCHDPAPDDLPTTRSSDCFRVATLLLRQVHKRNLDDKLLVLYEAWHGRHCFINPEYQWIGRLREKFRKSPSGNINLEGNLREQVSIAYSIPRIISLITLRAGELMNMFPTDLHGAVDDCFYLSSLRIGGKANRQIETSGKLAIASMNADLYKYVYSLGRNHMQELKSITAFNLLNERSEKLELPLPEGLLRYHELERFDSVDIGLHRIHFYRILNSTKVCDGMSLAHVGQYFAQWRINHNLPINMMLR